MDGTVIEHHDGGMYTVQLDDGSVVRAHCSGRLRMNFVRVTKGHRVTVEQDPNDSSKGRITYRYRE